MKSERQIQVPPSYAQSDESHPRNARTPGSVSGQGYRILSKKCFFHTNPISPYPGKNEFEQTNPRSDCKQRNDLGHAATSHVLRTHTHTLYNCFPASLDKKC